MARERYSAAQWAEWVSEQKSSRQRVADFCQTKGLSTQTFYLWRRRLSVVGETGEEGASFVELAVRALETIGIELPCGAVIRVPADQATLLLVVDALLRAGDHR